MFYNRVSDQNYNHLNSFIMNSLSRTCLICIEQLCAICVMFVKVNMAEHSKTENILKLGIQSDLKHLIVIVLL